MGAILPPAYQWRDAGSRGIYIEFVSRNLLDGEPIWIRIGT